MHESQLWAAIVPQVTQAGSPGPGFTHLFTQCFVQFKTENLLLVRRGCSIASSYTH